MKACCMFLLLCITIIQIPTIRLFGQDGITVAGGHGVGSAANQFAAPNSVFVDASGNIYVADPGNQRVQKWAPGASAGVTVARGNIPSDVFVDATGNIYVTERLNFRVQKWAPGASVGVTVAGGNGFGSAANQLFWPEGVFVDENANIYVGEIATDRVQKWAPGALAGVTVAGGNGRGSAANQLWGASDVYVDAAGNVFVYDIRNNRIQKWAPGASEGITVAGGNGAGSAANQFQGLRGFYIDASGNIFVADMLNNRIQKWAPGASESITVAGGHGVGSAANQLNDPIDVFVDGSGNIFVVDRGNSRILKFGLSLASICPPSRTVKTDTGQCSAVVNNLDLTASYNNVSVNYTLSGATIGSGSGTVSGKTFNTGVTTVTYSLSNDVTNTCYFTVTVQDNEAPVISCPPATELTYNLAGYTLVPLKASENCGIKNITFKITGASSRTGTGTDASGSFNPGINNITWTVEDSNGNTSTCSTIVTINQPETVNKLTLKVHPNPSKSFFTVTLNSSNLKQPIIVNVYNVFGKIIETRRVMAGQNIKIGDAYYPGIYFIEAMQNKQREYKVLIKL